MRRTLHRAAAVFAAVATATSLASSTAAADPLAAGARDRFGVPVRESYATTPDGIRIYYRVAGSGSETVIAPFALYHGTVLDTLAKGRRIVTYDPRGRGKSQAAPLERLSLDYLLSDLDTVRRAVGAKEVSIIGWSGGGMETFVYTLRNPQHVSRLVQLAPVTARADPYMEQMIADRRKRTDQSAWNALQAKIKAGDFAKDAAAQCRAQNEVDLPALLADRASLALIPDVCDSANEQPPTLGKYFGALWPSISTFDWRSSLGKVTIPRLVIYPLRDNITRAGVEEWVRGQPNARILYVANSGHFPQFEQPAATLRAIDTFLRGKWPEDAQALPKAD